MDTDVVLVLLFTHWVADFVMQTDYQALNKSEKWLVLLGHSAIYAGVFCLLFFIAYLVYPHLPGFIAIASIGGTLLVSHFTIDAVTSRVNKWLWGKGLRYWFFISIGFDQWLHYAVLFWLFK
jgi:uncharacterized membrane protein HdeD (DUF308 family)